MDHNMKGRGDFYNKAFWAMLTFFVGLLPYIFTHDVTRGDVADMIAQADKQSAYAQDRSVISYKLDTVIQQHEQLSEKLERLQGDVARLSSGTGISTNAQREQKLQRQKFDEPAKPKLEKKLAVASGG
jgi:hypothetical protein